MKRGQRLKNKKENFFLFLTETQIYIIIFKFVSSLILKKLFCKPELQIVKKLKSESVQIQVYLFSSFNQIRITNCRKIKIRICNSSLFFYFASASSINL